MPPKTIVLIGGGQAAGKRTVADALSYRLKEWKVLNVSILNMNDFQKEEIPPEGNPEGPEAYDFESLINRVLQASSDVVIVRGTYALYNRRLRDMGVVKIYIYEDDDTRLSRRIKRDLKERSMALQEVLDSYLAYGRPAMEKYIQGTREHADVVLMRGAEFQGMEIIAGAIYDRLSNMSHGSMTDSRSTDLSSSGFLTPTAISSSYHSLLETEFEHQTENFYEIS
ncbi:P-loop containing nucleoside triphosphate hydrolase protein [Dipodascopsis uninucleata]